jgi:hypothetical protein
VELTTHTEADPAADVAYSRALLERVARGGAPAVRLWRPLRPALSLGRIDLQHPNVGEVIEAAAAAGVTPVRRLAGGRAAAFDERCLCLAWSEPAPKLEEWQGRYEAMADVLVAAFRRLGVVAETGELEGEWCPGAWSVRGPHGKLAGLAQRIIVGGAWCEALIVIDRGPELTALSRRAHELLEIPWSEAAQGGLARELPDADDPHALLAAALLDVLRERVPGLREADPDPGTLRRARELADEQRLL